jgi:hypothetical protein
MASSTVISRTLQKAAEMAGGEKALARKLRVPLGELDKWIAGDAKPPMAIFLKAVDVVLEEAPPQARNRGQSPDSGSGV